MSNLNAIYEAKKKIFISDPILENDENEEKHILWNEDKEFDKYEMQRNEQVKRNW